MRQAYRGESFMTDYPASLIHKEMRLGELRKLADSAGFPALLINHDKESVEGVISEFAYWRSLAIYGEEAFVDLSINKNFKMVNELAEIQNSAFFSAEFFIVPDSSGGFFVYEKDQLKNVWLKEQLYSTERMNDLLKEEIYILQKKVVELEQVINTSYDEIFVTDGEGKVLLVSDACQRMTGVPKERFLGENIYNLAKAGLINNSVTIDVLKKKKMVSAKQSYPNGVQVVATGIPIFDHEGNIYRVITNSRDITELVQLKNELAEAKSILNERSAEDLERGKGPLFTHNDDMLALIDMAKKVAVTESTILIQGESGVGKGILAKIIHEESLRKDRSFVSVNCGAIPLSLIESELFGYESGAFTGAKTKGKAGLVELADGGTLFLDEVGELPLEIQVKLLHLVQEKTFRRVGSNQLRKVNIRIISATNKDLKSMMEKGLFREDLYYRLHVVPLNILPLRKRVEDIPFLLQLFLEEFNEKYDRNVIISDESLAALRSYSWPGNVRELENMVEQLVVTASTDIVFLDCLPDQVKSGNGKPLVVMKGIIPLNDAVESVEKQLLNTAIDKYKTSRKIAAALKVNQTTVIRKLKKYGLSTTGIHPFSDLK
ncbi:PAS domain S-box protein [Siminovitchia terrae]|uniref:HTH-type transcriptional regulatory protein TyrR n=2 Tax=Siminovitchia terrae TaxID=1914933 RepID=A0A429X326_SIMTE|nr:PAS domain S-box protein [Siminovitchia terrae]